MTTALDRIAELDGLMNPGIGPELYRLAKIVPVGQAIVELGSFKGKSTAYLAQGAKDGNEVPVYAVDPWDLAGNVYGKHGFTRPEVREAFEAQLKKVRLWGRVTQVQAFSTDYADVYDGPPVGLLFIDGDHRYEPVKADFEAWEPLLASGAVVAFDDYDTKPNPGVARFVGELAAAGFDVQIVHDHLAVLREG